MRIKMKRKAIHVKNINLMVWLKVKTQERKNIPSVKSCIV